MVSPSLEVAHPDPNPATSISRSAQRHVQLFCRPGSLALATWRVSGIAAELREFCKRLLSSFQHAGVKEPMQCMSQPGRSGIAGACKGVVIPFYVVQQHEFLADLFKQGLQHRSINMIRSAVFMTHSPMEGVPIGQHSSVCRLMRGIHNICPPTPQYTSTWYVDKVVHHLDSWDQMSLCHSSICQ